MPPYSRNCPRSQPGSATRFFDSRTIYQTPLDDQPAGASLRRIFSTTACSGRITAREDHTVQFGRGKLKTKVKTAGRRHGECCTGCVDRHPHCRLRYVGGARRQRRSERSYGTTRAMHASGGGWRKYPSSQVRKNRLKTFISSCCEFYAALCASRHSGDHNQNYILFYTPGGLKDTLTFCALTLL